MGDHGGLHSPHTAQSLGVGKTRNPEGHVGMSDEFETTTMFAPDGRTIERLVITRPFLVPVTSRQARGGCRDPRVLCEFNIRIISWRGDAAIACRQGSGQDTAAAPFIKSAACKHSTRGTLTPRICTFDPHGAWCKQSTILNTRYY
jgi:hypothetical protein